MASFKAVAAAAGLVLLSTANAHFNLNTPPSIGFNDDKEDIAPCGFFTPDFTNKSALVDFHVGGEPVGVKLGHSQANWLYRATLDETASGNWTQLFPIVQQSGLGLFCEPAIPAPASWVGKQGVVSVVANAPDGLLYQCATVNFVAGTGTVGSSCTNGSVQASFVSDTQLSALVDGSSNTTTTPSSTTTSTPTETSAAASSTSSASSKNAAAGLNPALGSLASAAALSLLGLALL